MGLLDDAIREHLELKRRRGADPGEIAHQERAALEPVSSGEPEPAGGALEEALPQADTDTVLAADDDLAAAEPAVDPLSAPAEEAPALAPAGQETAELDMEEVLAADPDAAEQAAAPPRLEGSRMRMDESAAREDDSLEWEIPRRAGQEPPPEDVAGQERLSFE